MGLGTISEVKETKELILELSKKSSVPIDLHTFLGSYWSNGYEVEFIKSFPADPKFVTGAGDVWDAANIIGYITDLDPIQRLGFANCAASLYVGNSNGIPPRMDEVLSLLETAS
jgi:ribokinase